MNPCSRKSQRGEGRRAQLMTLTIVLWFTGPLTLFLRPKSKWTWEVWLLEHEGHSWAVSGSISQLTSENVEGEDGDPDGDRDGNGNGRWYVGAGEINIWMRANCRRFIDYAGEAADANPTCITEGSTTHHSIPFNRISPHDFAHLAHKLPLEEILCRARQKDAQRLNNTWMPCWSCLVKVRSVNVL